MLEFALLQWLKVPPMPQAPDGSPESIQVFRAGKNYYRWRVLIWGLTHLAVVAGLVAAIIAFNLSLRKAPPKGQTIALVIETLVVFAMSLYLPFTFFLQRLDYRMRWYIVTDRSLRIRSGVWSVEEQTMTFANIQDLAVTAGPLQGFLGLADVEVRSAGGGKVRSKEGGLMPSHVARFAGVDNAEALRDLILARLRHYRDTGLGDPDAAPHPSHSPQMAAEMVLAEARALRASLK